MPDVELVTAKEILSKEGASRPVIPYTFLQLVGVQLAVGVGGLIAVVILALLGYWIFSATSIGVASVSADPEKIRQLIELQKQARDAHFQQITLLFDSIVTKCLLPLFTTILGYIFGSQAAKQSRD
jgi:hypothetical protein